jgi:uncharacterized repeat protein (TIGR01451 family)
LTNAGNVTSPQHSWLTVHLPDDFPLGDCPGKTTQTEALDVAVHPFAFGGGEDPVFFVQSPTDSTPFFDIHNPDNDTNLELAVIEFNAQVDNIATNQTSTVLSDRFQVQFRDEEDFLFASDSDKVNVEIVEPNLTVVKLANPTTVMPGGTVTYDVTIANTGSASAFENTFTDSLPPELMLVDQDFPVPAGCTNQSTLPGNVNVTCPELGQDMTTQLTYQAQISTTVSCNAIVTNTAKVAWTSLPGPQGTTANLTGQSTSGQSGAATPPNTAVNGERNGSSNFTPFPPGSPNPPNDYFATASAAVTVTCSSGWAYICIFKFCDRDENGVQGTDEPGLAPWKFKVVDASGTPIPWSPLETLAGGKVCVDVLAPGTYTVSEEPQAAWVPQWVQTYPDPPGTYTVSVAANDQIDLTFGNRRVDNQCEIPTSK